MGEDLLQAIGLLLSQLRIARRALEDIERSTARYNSFAFASALSAGASFGAPPMFGGALKVWIVNINDLAPGANGGFLEQLLGGVGRLLGGFGGGAVGAFIGGVTLPGMISDVKAIADTVERILIRLVSSDSGKKDAAGKKPDGPGLLDTIGQWMGVIKAFTALLQAGSGKGEDAQKTSDSMTPGAERWMALVKSTAELINGIDRVVQGLIFLIPIVVGGLAELLTSLSSIKLAILGLLEFFLKELFLLRGILLVTIYDTVSAAAKLGATILSILGDAVGSIVSSIFTALGDVFGAATAAIRFLSDGLQKTVDSVVHWLVDTLSAALFSIGNSLVFREVIHLVEILPAILPSLVYAFRGQDAFEAVSTKALSDAAAKTIAPPATPAVPGMRPSSVLPGPPTIAATLLDRDSFAKLEDTVKAKKDELDKQVTNSFGTASGAFSKLSQSLDEAAKDKTFTKQLESHTDGVRKSAQTMVDSINLGQVASLIEAKANEPSSGLKDIATAYEAWLAGNGLTSLLKNVTDYFLKSGTAEAIKDKAAGTSMVDRPRATIDIQDVVIELGPAAPAPVSMKEGESVSKEPGLTHDQLLKMLAELSHELHERGFKRSPGSLLAQV